MPRPGRAQMLAAAAAVTTGVSLTTARANEAVADPQALAVNIERTPAQPWPGYGIYLGDGLVITAAHVAGRAFMTHPRVVVAGRPLPTESVKEGSYPDNDLTVLRLEPPVPPELAGLRTEVCADPPHPGEAVVVATPEKVTTSSVISPDVLPPDMRIRYSASIKDVYTTGNSGSGVFDATSRCLLGIMSSKIETRQVTLLNGALSTRTIGLAKHFVPSTDIRRFLADLPRP